jgi:hypothetical protein
LHNHWDKHLDLKQLILWKRPSVIVECGAGTGELTRLLASLLDVYPFKLFVISDAKVDGLDERINWNSGLSYEMLSSFDDGSIDLCIIDTDHNYWTLMKEFSAIMNKISEGGLIALHDVETFYHNTGMAMSYWDGKPYPKEAIEEHAKFGSLGDAMIDFLQMHKLNYKLFAYTPESQGAAILQRHTQPVFAIVCPGSNPAYAKQNKEAVYAGI